MKNKFDAVKQALSNPAPAKPKKDGHVREIRIRKGSNGGFISKHEMEDEQGMMMGRDREFPMSSLDEVHKHIDEHFGEKKSESKAKK